MGKKGLIWGVLTALLLVVAYAWIDGGLRPLAEISAPVAIPGGAR
jgi:hypothetical protein